MIVISEQLQTTTTISSETIAYYAENANFGHKIKEQQEVSELVLDMIVFRVIIVFV